MKPRLDADQHAKMGGALDWPETGSSAAPCTPRPRTRRRLRRCRGEALDAVGQEWMPLESLFFGEAPSGASAATYYPQENQPPPIAAPGHRERRHFRAVCGGFSGKLPARTPWALRAGISSEPSQCAASGNGAWSAGALGIGSWCLG